MALIQGWLPPSRENYDFILFLWQLYPIFPSLQWLIKWYGMGKTSKPSMFNVPGRLAWTCMECPGVMSLLYIMKTLPAEHGIGDLPWQNKVLAGLFAIHYSYRAVLFPIIQPSMAPIHVFVAGAALTFQLFNGVCIGAWLAAYGPTTQEAWAAQWTSPLGVTQFIAGIAVFYVGLAANYFHDEELREIRRREERRRERVARQNGFMNGDAGNKKPDVDRVEGHYSIPQAGLFKYVLYPHYLTEWVEWFGFYVAAGFSSVPARMFLVNEIAAMLPRAVSGRQWYIERFGEDKIKRKRAVIPGLL